MSEKYITFMGKKWTGKELMEAGIYTQWLECCNHKAQKDYKEQCDKLASAIEKEAKESVKNFSKDVKDLIQKAIIEIRNSK
jgi:hypothetical protein